MLRRSIDRISCPDGRQEMRFFDPMLQRAGMRFSIGRTKGTKIIIFYNLLIIICLYFYSILPPFPNSFDGIKYSDLFGS
jgi:hypothetical protein